MKIGETLYLILLSQGEETEEYRSKLVDKTEDEIYIDFPVRVDTKRTEIFSVDTPFLVTYQEGQNVFQFKSYIKKRNLSSIPTLVLPLPPKEEHRRIQRRAHFRVETSVDVAVHCSQNSFPPFTTVTKDISGGGISLFIEKEVFKEEVPLHIALVLKPNPRTFEYIFVVAKFIRYKHEESGIKTASLQFIEIDEKDRQKIISFCFKKERKQRKQETYLENK